MRALSLFLSLALVSSAWGDTVTDVRAALDALIAERGALLARIKEKDADLATLKKTVASLQTTVASLRTTVTSLQGRVPAPTTCTVPVALGTAAIPWETIPAGGVVCLDDGDHQFSLEPPVGLGGLTVRATNWGKASVTHIDLANNLIGIDGVAVLHNGVRAVWTRWP